MTSATAGAPLTSEISPTAAPGPSSAITAPALCTSQRPATVRLYNLAEDPTERHNVAGEHPERVQRMLAALAAHVAQQAKPAWPAQMEMPVRIDKHDAQPWSADDEYVYVTN